MENLFFFPTLDDQMIDDSGLYGSEYEFSYCFNGTYRVLKTKGKSIVKLEDPLELWSLEKDGLRFSREVILEYPEVLKGPRGVVCKDAEIGICVIWNNRALKQMGYIMPKNIMEEGGKKVYCFEHYFNEGEIQGDLYLKTVLYVKEAAEIVDENERQLINEAGVTVGIVDSLSINFSDISMEFPIIDVKDKTQPLWWLELKDWEDPTKDPFNEDHVCLYLNSYYDCCPKVGDQITNLDLLIEIISSSYFLLFQKVEEWEKLNATLNDEDLEPGSISKVLHYLYTSQIHPISLQPPEALLKSIHQTVEAMLKGNAENDTL